MFYIFFLNRRKGNTLELEQSDLQCFFYYCPPCPFFPLCLFQYRFFFFFNFFEAWNGNLMETCMSNYFPSGTHTQKRNSKIFPNANSAFKHNIIIVIFTDYSRCTVHPAVDPLSLTVIFWTVIIYNLVSVKVSFVVERCLYDLCHQDVGVGTFSPNRHIVH